MILSPDDLRSALQWRYATKQFNPALPIEESTWQALLDTLVLTPSSFGLQPWKFFVIENPALRESLRALAWNQSQVTDASRFIVLAARTDLTAEDIDAWINRRAEVSGTTPDTLAPMRDVIEGFAARMTAEERRIWNTRQIYIALGNLMTAAAAIGVDTCPMEGIDPTGFDKVLGLDGSGYATVVACALGYRNPEDRFASMPKARYERDQVISVL